MAYHRVHGVRDADRAHLQHVRPAHARRGRARDPRLHEPGAAQRRRDRLRRRQPDAQLLLRVRPRRRHLRLIDVGRGRTRSTSATRTRSPSASSPRRSSRSPGSTQPHREPPAARGRPKVRQPDITRARTILGWEPKVPLDGRPRSARSPTSGRSSAWPDSDGTPVRVLFHGRPQDRGRLHGDAPGGHQDGPGRRGPPGHGRTGLPSWSPPGSTGRCSSRSRSSSASRSDVDLDVMRPNQTLAGLTARLMERIDGWLDDGRPDMALVQGDTTTVLVAAAGLLLPAHPRGPRRSRACGPATSGRRFPRR